VSEVLTRFEDGRLNILVEGGRFRLDELTEGRSFQTGGFWQFTTRMTRRMRSRSRRRCASSVFCVS
jgi:hypothetical protein